MSSAVNFATFVISDTHLGKCLASEPEFSQIASAEGILEFLKFVAKVNFARLILLGDIFDFWAHPLDRKPPANLNELIMGSPVRAHIEQVCAALADLSHRIPVIYVLGNHDWCVTQRDVARCISPDIPVYSRFIYDGVTYEHGCEYDIACAAIPLRDPQKFLPIGYYATRCGATAGRSPEGTSRIVRRIMAAKSVESLATIQDAMMLPCVAQRIWKGVIKSALGRRGKLTDADVCIDPDGSAVKLTDVIAERRDVPAAFAAKFAGCDFPVARMVNVSAGECGYWQRWCAARDNAKCSVFAHTHRVLGEAAPCFNCGTMGPAAARKAGRGTFLRVTDAVVEAYSWPFAARIGQPIFLRMST